MKAKKRIPSKKPARAGKRKVKIFISHSSRDASLVTLIIDLLRTSTLKKEEIRCTSVRGYGLRAGKRIPKALRKDIEKCEIVIGVLTKDALASFNVLLELGAGWGLKKRLVPITGPRVKFESLPQWLREKHGMKWNHEECWEDFDEDVFQPLGKTITDEARFKRIIKQLIKWQSAEKLSEGRKR